MKRKKINTLIVLIIGIALFASSTILAQEKVKVTQTQHLSNMNALKIKRDSTLAVIKTMDLPKLLNQMNKDSRTREHFNSPAYREIVRNRKANSQELVSIIKAQQKVTYIPLMAVRKINKEAYGEIDTQVKLTALTDALKQTVMYNRWGIPHLYWQSPAKAMVEIGSDAEPVLKRFLGDKSMADIMGHEEELELKAYKYRRCDYALAMLLEIRGKNVKEIPQDPGKRDEMIEKILSE